MRTKSQSWRVGFAIALLTISTFCVQVARSQWTLQNVDTNGNSGFVIRTALDYESASHAAYFVLPGSLKTADMTGPSWSPGQSFVTIGHDLQLNRKDQLGLVYVNSAATGISFSERSLNGTFVPATILSGNFAEYASLAYDNLNHPHIAYIDTAASALKQLYWNGAGWQSSTVATSASFASNRTASAKADIAVDAQGAVYFTWYDSASNSLMFAKPNGSTWTSSVVSANFAYGRPAFDNHGALHIAYETLNQVYYATYNGATWSSQLIDSIGITSTTGKPPSLAFDANDQPHVAYAINPAVNSPTDGLKHAWFQDGQWTTETITTWPNTLGGPEAASMMVDRRGGVRIVYADDSEDIRYATKAGASGQAIASMTPVFDTQANSTSGGPFSLADGSILINQYRSPSSENRGVMEFNVSAVPAGATIVSAQLQLQITGFATNAGQSSSIDLYGYNGDGLATIADASAITHMIGSSGPLTSSGVISIDLDPAYTQTLLSQGNFMGLVAMPGLDFYQSSFASSEYAQQVPGVLAPTLVITYLPEPGGIALLGALAAIAICRRRSSAIAARDFRYELRSFTRLMLAAVPQNPITIRRDSGAEKRVEVYQSSQAGADCAQRARGLISR